MSTEQTINTEWTYLREVDWIETSDSHYHATVQAMVDEISEMVGGWDALLDISGIDYDALRIDYDATGREEYTPGRRHGTAMIYRLDTVRDLARSSLDGVSDDLSERQAWMMHQMRISYGR